MPNRDAMFTRLSLSSGGFRAWRASAVDAIDVAYPHAAPNDPAPRGGLLLRQISKGVPLAGEIVRVDYFSGDAVPTADPKVLMLRKSEFERAERWAAAQQAGIGYIRAALVEPEVRDRLDGTELTIVDVLDKLERELGDQTFVVAISALEEFARPQRDDETLGLYVARKLNCAKQLSMGGVAQSDTTIALSLISGLAPAHDSLRQVLLLIKRSDLKLETVVQRMREDCVGRAATVAVANAAVSGGKKALSGTSTSAPCDHPSHPGAAHAPAACYEYHPDLKPTRPVQAAAKPRKEKAKKTKGSSNVVSYGCSTDSVDSCSPAPLRGLRSPERPTTAAPASTPLRARTLLANSPVDRNLHAGEAILDSGTTEHIFFDRGSFLHVTSFPEPRRIYVGDDRWLAATGYGPVELRSEGRDGKASTVRLEGCWLAPDFKVNLVSTGRLNDAGLTSTFSPDKACRVTTKRGAVLLRGSRRACGCVLDARIVRRAATALAATTLEGWHCRCGHVSYRSLKAMIDQGLVVGLDLAGELGLPERDDGCVACALGKAFTLPFPEGRKRATAATSGCTSTWAAPSCRPGRTASATGSA